jgi:HlyD family secretion protein
MAPVARARPKKLFPWWTLPAIGLVAVAAIALWIKPWQNGNGEVISGQFFTVSPMDLEVKINKDGEIQAVSYTDVKSELETSSTIISIIPEGSTVKKGDVLVKLDSITLQQKKEQIELELRKADSLKKIAMEMKEIQDSQNQANKEAAEVAVQLAELDLKQYIEGTYPQSVENAKTALSMAKLTLKNVEEDLDQTKTLFTKGFVTASDVKKGELQVTTARNEVQKATTALMVLEKYMHQMQMATLNSALAQAEQKLFRTLKENASTLNQKYADLEEKQESLALLQRQAQKLDEQLAACTIRAPEDGLVIYASSIERREREPVQEGTQVRQNQWLLRLPDVSRMKVLLKVQEAWKPRLDENKRMRALVKILGVPRPVGATLTKVSVLPDNSQRWWNPDLREYPLELTLDETPPGLKPGMRVENAEIFIERKDQVLAVPLTAIYSVGNDSFVFVRNGQIVKERKISLGTANETHVQVTSGLADGDQVLLLQPGQGRMLLEKSGIKVTEKPTTQPGQGRARGRRGAGATGEGGPERAPENAEPPMQPPPGMERNGSGIREGNGVGPVTPGASDEPRRPGVGRSGSITDPPPRTEVDREGGREGTREGRGSGTGSGREGRSREGGGPRSGVPR